MRNLRGAPKAAKSCFVASTASGAPFDPASRDQASPITLHSWGLDADAWLEKRGRRRSWFGVLGNHCAAGQKVGGLKIGEGVDLPQSARHCW